MLNIVITLLTFVLILISLFLVLVILMQRANSNAGMGSAFGGGVTESAFGAETTNILTRATKWSAMAFFILALVLYLLYMYKANNSDVVAEDLPDIPVVEVEPAVEETPAVDTSEEPAAANEPVNEPDAAEETPAP